jgi:hypothetical protein
MWMQLQMLPRLVSATGNSLVSWLDFSGKQRGQNHSNACLCFFLNKAKEIKKIEGGNKSSYFRDGGF